MPCLEADNYLPCGKRIYKTISNIIPKPLYSPAQINPVWLKLFLFRVYRLTRSQSPWKKTPAKRPCHIPAENFSWSNELDFSFVTTRVPKTSQRLPKFTDYFQRFLRVAENTRCIDDLWTLFFIVLLIHCRAKQATKYIDRLCRLFLVLWSPAGTSRLLTEVANLPCLYRTCSELVSFAAVIRVVTHRSSPLTAAHSTSAFLSSNWPMRSRLPYSGNLVFGGKCNEKYDWRAANKYMHVIGSQ